MYFTIKRILDLILSTIGILILLPMLILISIAIKIDSPGPILFRQRRIGRNKNEFYILKFRTMRVDTPKDTPTHLLDNPNMYITKIGNILRKTSLDELPQLFNILIGNMSIVGPRPALWNQYDLIAKRDKYGANNIMPGLTGWAQVNGRDELPIEIKAEYDGEYVKKMSFLFDLKCCLKTIYSVIKRDGIVEGKNEKDENEKIKD